MPHVNVSQLYLSSPDLLLKLQTLMSFVLNYLLSCLFSCWIGISNIICPNSSSLFPSSQNCLLTQTSSSINGSINGTSIFPQPKPKLLVFHLLPLLIQNHEQILLTLLKIFKFHQFPTLVQATLSLTGLLVYLLKWTHYFHSCPHRYSSPYSQNNLAKPKLDHDTHCSKASSAFWCYPE